MVLLFIFLLLILIFYTYQEKWNPVRPDFYHSEEMIKIGHRGAPALAPENTIESFTKAFEAEITGVELDVQLSNDGELVVFHDWDLSNITGSSKQIKDMDYLEMRDLVAQPEYLSRKKLANQLYGKFPNQFIPRYNMVSFSSIPYAEVYRRGMVQKEIISNLNIENMDMLLAESLIKEQLEPVN